MVSLVFCAVTLATMLSMVQLSRRGLSLLPLQHIERYSHALAGTSLALAGGAIEVLGV